MKYEKITAPMVDITIPLHVLFGLNMGFPLKFNPMSMGFLN
jgi:hypothetical protein